MAGVKRRFKANPPSGTWSIRFDLDLEDAAALDRVRGFISRSAFAKEATLNYIRIYDTAQGQAQVQMEHAIRQEPIAVG